MTDTAVEMSDEDVRKAKFVAKALFLSGMVAGSFLTLFCMLLVLVFGA